MIAIIDYGAGNLRSIQRAFETIGAPATITTDPAMIATADAVVFPGVGHAGTAMRRLRELGLPASIRQAVAAGKPFLGVCLGMQLLFGHQDEGDAEGLGILGGRVRALSGPIKVPHIGWNQSRVVKSSPIGPAGAEDYYYFVHSFVVEPADAADIAAEATYGVTFPSIVIHDNVWGTQFHPEKSGDTGLRLLRAFAAHLAAPSSTRHSEVLAEASPREAQAGGAGNGRGGRERPVMVARFGSSAAAALRRGSSASAQNDGESVG